MSIAVCSAVQRVFAPAHGTLASQAMCRMRQQKLERPTLTLDFSTLLLLTITTNIGLGLLCSASSVLQPGVRGVRRWRSDLLDQ